MNDNTYNVNVDDSDNNGYQVNIDGKEINVLTEWELGDSIMNANIDGNDATVHVREMVNKMAMHVFNVSLKIEMVKYYSSEYMEIKYVVN